MSNFSKVSQLRNWLGHMESTWRKQTTTVLQVLNYLVSYKLRNVDELVGKLHYTEQNFSFNVVALEVLKSRFAEWAV